MQKKTLIVMNSSLSKLLIIFMLLCVSRFGIAQDYSVIGKWTSDSDTNWTIEFNEQNECVWRYNENVTEQFSYAISNISPQCGYDVPVDDSTSYLELSNTKNGNTLCYEINGITEEILSLRLVEQGGFLLFKRQ